MEREAGMVTDSGFVLSSKQSGPTCKYVSFDAGSPFQCAPPTECCVDFATSSCVAADAAASCVVRLACDGPEDCTGGQACRAQGSPLFAACASGSASGDYCHDSTQCQTGFVCCQPKLTLDDGGYAPPPVPGSAEAQQFINGGCIAIGDVHDGLRCDL